MTNKILEIEGLSARYNEKTALHNVNICLYENDYLGIIGPNGGGKTTFVKCILGLKSDYSGKITFYRKGEKVNNLKIGYLPQYTVIDKKFPISVKEVVLSGLNRGIPILGGFNREQKEKANIIIEQMGLSEFSDKNIGALSGGQIQRALLGRAIISNPELLILDEPSTYVDKYYEAKLYEIIEKINKKCTIILVSHDIGTVLQNVKSIACINETLEFHPDTNVSEDWLTQKFNCPIDMVGHGDLPHRILKRHS